jgi:hypothetical protein
MRRWLANRLESWSDTLREWADRVRPPYRRPPGVPETPLERITREQLAQDRAGYIKDWDFATTPDWPQLTAKPYKVGETLRIRLSNDYEVKDDRRDAAGDGGDARPPGA